MCDCCSMAIFGFGGVVAKKKTTTKKHGGGIIVAEYFRRGGYSATINPLPVLANTAKMA